MSCNKCKKECEFVPKRRICRECYNLDKIKQKEKRNLPERKDTCSKCNEIKILPKNKHWCKDCKNKYENERRSLDRDKINKQSKEYYKHKKDSLKNVEHNFDNTTKKICNKCNCEKTLDMFYFAKHKGYYHSYCKECDKNLHKMNYKENRVDRIKQTTAYQNNKRKTDPNFKNEKLLRTRVYSALKNQNAKKFNNTMKLLGCSPLFLKEYLEKQFKEGMSWDNHTTDGWHIDHIRPCCSFELTKKEQQEECFHYTNLQPLWATDNFKKGGKTDYIIL